MIVSNGETHEHARGRLRAREMTDFRFLLNTITTDSRVNLVKLVHLVQKGKQKKGNIFPLFCCRSSLSPGSKKMAIVHFHVDRPGCYAGSKRKQDIFFIFIALHSV